MSVVNKTNAQSGSINIVTTAVPFLRISPDARAGGMADAGIATSSDAFNSYWNLAKTPFSTTKTLIGATYTPWLQDLGVNDLYMVNIGAIHKLDDQQGISGSVRYFGLGSIQATTDGTNNYGTIRPFEFSIDGGYSRKLSDKLALGVGLRYIRSNLTNGSAQPSIVQYQAATAVSGDIHLYYDGTKK
ncbi:MAG: PorV/PorQ family protein [Ferruginibacter sp.]